MKKVDACKDSQELLNLVMSNAMRFRDENGRPLDIVKELHNYVSKKNDEIEFQEDVERKRNDMRMFNGYIDDFVTDMKRLSKEEQKTYIEKERKRLNNEIRLKKDKGMRAVFRMQLKALKRVENYFNEQTDDEKHENRSQAMKGNQNAKKYFTDEIKEKVLKDILSPTEERLKLDYTRENYNKLFPIGYAETPIGKIKLGEHQFERLGEKDNGTRKEYLGALSQALKEPNVIIDDVDEKGRHAKLFIKSFKDFNGNEYYVAITPTIDGIDVVVSNGARRENQILEKIKKASMYYYAPGSQTIGTAEALPNNSSIPQSDIKSIRKNYESSKSVTGNKKTITLPNGEKMKCHYKLVEANAPVASHNEETFSSTQGFPKTKDGKNINDRDYQNDKDAQESVRKLANNFNSLALYSPPIVTKDGIVISGNNRTMSSKLAAKNGTDKEYLTSLNEMIEEFGIDEEELENFKNPRIILEVDAEHEGDYTTQEFAQFNQDTKKTMNNVEKAVKLTKTLNANKIQSIAECLTDYDTMSDLYNDSKASQKFVYNLVQNGIIGDNEKAQFLTSDGMLNDTGKDFVETVLVGSVLNEDNIRKLDSAGGKRIRQKLVRAILPLIENKGTGKEYSFNDELNKAVNIAIEVTRNHDKFGNVKEYLSQQTLFDEGKIDSITERLAEIIHDDGEKVFAQRMKKLGAGLRESSSGVQDIFVGGVESKESLMKRFLEIKKALKNISYKGLLFIDKQGRFWLKKGGAV